MSLKYEPFDQVSDYLTTEGVPSYLQDRIVQWDQIVFFDCLDLYHTPPDPGAQQYKSRI